MTCEYRKKGALCQLKIYCMHELAIEDSGLLTPSASIMDIEIWSKNDASPRDLEGSGKRMAFRPSLYGFQDPSSWKQLRETGGGRDDRPFVDSLWFFGYICVIIA